MKKALDAAAVIATITIAGWNYQQNKGHLIHLNHEK